MIQGDLASSSLSSAQDVDLFPAFTTRESKKFRHWFQRVQDQGKHFLVCLRHPKPPKLPWDRGEGLGLEFWGFFGGWEGCDVWLVVWGFFCCCSLVLVFLFGWVF